LKIHFLTGVLLCSLFSVVAHSQTAIFFCSETGAYSFIYGADTKADAEQAAYNKFISYGGTNPVLILSTEQKGYGAIALGLDSTGHPSIGASAGWDTQDHADGAGWRACAAHGGLNIHISDEWNDVVPGPYTPKQDSTQQKKQQE
jgi:hypothetical protein